VLSFGECRTPHPKRIPRGSEAMVYSPERVVIFSLDNQRYGLGLTLAERVLPAVEITPLPKGPAIVLGVFDLQGRIVPVMNLRRRFGLPERPLSPDDQFIIARAGGRTVALVVDATAGVTELPAGAIVDAAALLPELPHLRGVARLPDGLVLLHDLETFLALDEAAALDRALRERGGGASVP
jgi:purine-binding chemotaxis protein CheW